MFLEDGKNLLRWEKYDFDREHDFLMNDIVVDSWSRDPAIRKYVSDDFDLSISDQFKKTILVNKKDRFAYVYCYEGNDLVGVVLTSGPTQKCELSAVEYIIVNPKKRNRGIGLRMSKSIRENPKFFFHNYKGKIDALVHEYNFTSQEIFEYAGYKQIPNRSIEEYGYVTLYFEDEGITGANSEDEMGPMN